MVSEPLSEAEREALACVATGHHPDHCDCNDEYAEPDRYCQYAHETFARVEQIVAARTQALEAEVDRLRSIQTPAEQMLDEAGITWQSRARRLATRAEAAEAEVERLRTGLTELRDDMTRSAAGLGDKGQSLAGLALMLYVAKIETLRDEEA